MSPAFGKTAGGFLIVEGCSRQISLAGIGLSQVILQYRPENLVAAKRQRPVVGTYGETMHACPATDIAQSLDLVDILEVEG